MNAAGLLLLTLAQGPCDAGPAPEHPDAAAAAAYFEVAQDELARGSWEAARFSLREAARNAPGDPQIRAAWASVCPAPPKDAFRAGLEKMRARDCRGAIADFAAARAREPDPAAALLQGICLSELGRDQEAKAALEEARRSPELAEQAQLQLGMIAAREGRTRDADALLHPLAASADASVSVAARQAMRGLSGDGKLLLTAGVDAAADSNPYVIPDVVGNLPDGSFGVFGSALLRPLERSGPYARAYGLYRDQLQTAVFDAWSLGGAAGWQLGSGATFARAELGYDAMDLGGSPYLRAFRAELSGAVAGREGALLGSYQLRQERFGGTALAGALTGYSGLTHEVRAWAQRPLGEGSFAALGYRAFRADTADPVLAYVEHGPRAELQLRPWSSTRLRLLASYLWRPFDLADPRFGVARSDGVLEGGAEASVELSDEIELQLTGLAQLATSNVPAFQYTRFVLGVGVSFMGAPL